MLAAFQAIFLLTVHIPPLYRMSGYPFSTRNIEINHVKGFITYSSFKEKFS